MSFNARLKLTLGGLIMALASIPVAIVVTLVMIPFWSWLESATGIESLGHSGPAEWCYLVMYLLVLSIFGRIAFATFARRRHL